MTKRILSFIMTLTLIICLIPAGALSVSAEKTELEVKWNNGAIGGPTNNNKYKIISSTEYRYSDVITIEKAGTRVYYTAPTKAGLGHTLLAFSTWVKQGNDWVVDKAAANVDGTFLYGKSIGQTPLGNNTVLYEFITDHDNQSIRLSYRADGAATVPKVYAEPTTEPSTLAQLNARNFTATLDANGNVGNLQWFCGYASSASNTNGSAKEVRHASAAYAFSGLIKVPKAGTRITYSSSSYNTAFNAFTRYKLEGGRYVYDVGFDAGSTLVKSGSTYTYVTEYDNEVIRLCVKADKNYSNIAVDPPVTVKWEQTNEKGTAAGMGELKTKWPAPELLSLVTGAPLIATSEVKGLEWHDGYVGSQYHDSKAFVISNGNAVYDYSDVFTVPKAGTTVYFFDQTFTDHDDSKYASTSVMTVSHWKKVGSSWAFDGSKEYLNGCDVYNVLMTDNYRLYAYTTTEDNENLRLCMRYAPVYSTEEELIPPVYLVEPTDFTATDKTGEASYTDMSGDKVTYSIYLPEGYTADKQYTLVFDNSEDHAVAKALIAKNYKGIVLSYSGDLDISLRLLDEVVKNYPVKVSDLLAVGNQKLAEHFVKFEVIRLCQAMVITSGNAPSAKHAAIKAFSSFKSAEEAALWLVGETEDYYDILSGLKMYAIGDSYFGGSQLGQHQTWVNLLGYKYAMTFHNYGIGGNTVATAAGQSGNQPPMHTRYGQMPTDGDIYILEGGRNDRHYSVPFGTNDSTDTKTFKGALNVMIKGILAKNPDAFIVLVTPWSYLGEKGYLGTNNDYADAMKELAESYNDSRVICMYAADAKYTGVDMADASFRAKYCQTSSDVSHLNADGMYLVAPVFDKWLAEAYAKYKGVTLTNSADEEQFLEVKETETNAPEASASPETTEAPTETKPVTEKSGCGSAVANGIALVTVILAAAATVLKKKD